MKENEIYIIKLNKVTLIGKFLIEDFGYPDISSKRHDIIFEKVYNIIEDPYEFTMVRYPMIFDVILDLVAINNYDVVFYVNPPQKLLDIYEKLIKENEVNFYYKKLEGKRC